MNSGSESLRMMAFLGLNQLKTLGSFFRNEKSSWRDLYCSLSDSVAISLMLMTEMSEARRRSMVLLFVPAGVFSRPCTGVISLTHLEEAF